MFRGKREGEQRKPNPKRNAAAGPERAERFFQTLDSNQDGKLTLEEAPEPAKNILRRILERSGKEKDSEITKKEFMETLAAIRPGRRPEGRDADNEMKRPEMMDREVSRRGEFPRRPPAPAFVLTLDSDKDGRLSKEELSQVKRLFEKLDRNEDGYLDIQEMMGGDRRSMAGPRGRYRPDQRRPQRPDRPEKENQNAPQPKRNSDSKAAK